MLDTFQSHNSRDFRQRYNGSYGYYNNNGKKIFVLISAVGDHDVLFVDANETTYTIRADQGVEFEFIPVKKKLFVYRDELLYIRRRPARMWARGINVQNTEVTNVFGGTGQALSFPKMVKALEPNNDPLGNLIKLETKEVKSVALTDLFGITNSALYLYNNCIGSVDLDRRLIMLEQPAIFRQEVIDMVNKWQLPYTIQ